jgi:hypothetical protein
MSEENRMLACTAEEFWSPNYDPVLLLPHESAASLEEGRYFCKALRKF